MLTQPMVLDSELPGLLVPGEREGLSARVREVSERPVSGGPNHFRGDLAVAGATDGLGRSGSGQGYLAAPHIGFVLIASMATVFCSTHRALAK
jgi:hypothetical protein